MAIDDILTTVACLVFGIAVLRVIPSFTCKFWRFLDPHIGCYIYWLTVYHFRYAIHSDVSQFMTFNSFNAWALMNLVTLSIDIDIS